MQIDQWQDSLVHFANTLEKNQKNLVQLYKWKEINYVVQEHPNNVEIDEFLVKPDILCTTGVATCVAIVIQVYDKSGNFMFNYLKHDSLYGGSSLDDKIMILESCILEALTNIQCDTVKINMCVVGGVKDMMESEEETQQIIEEVTTSCQLDFELVYYNTSMNDPLEYDDGDLIDSTSGSVVVTRNNVWWFENAVPT